VDACTTLEQEYSEFVNKIYSLFICFCEKYVFEHLGKYISSHGMSKCQLSSIGLKKKCNG
jgi:hypothetical protein